MRVTLVLDGVLCIQCGYEGWVLDITRDTRRVIHEHPDVPTCRLPRPPAVTPAASQRRRSKRAP